MHRLALTILSAALLVASAAPVAATPLHGTASLCAPRRATIQGQQAAAYCGPATATVHARGRTFRFKNGTCSDRPTGVTLLLGTHVLGSRTNAGLANLTVIYNKRATAASVAWFAQGHSYGIAVATASLNRSRTAGAFSGQALYLASGGRPAKTTASGTFHC